MAEAIDLIADVQVRNRGTVGGAIAHADPASDFPAIALAFEGSAVLRGPGGERVVPLDGFFEGPFQTGIQPGRDPRRDPPRAAPAGHGVRLPEARPEGVRLPDRRHRRGHRAEGGTITHAAIGVTGVHEHAYRADDVESALVGSDGSAAAIAAAAAHVTDDVEVNSDIHADAEYRAAMAVVYTRRAIEDALGR